MKRTAKGARGASDFAARIVDAFCLALTVLCAALSVAAAVFGVATLTAGYPTFGGNGYCYVGEEGVPDCAEGRTLLVFRSCDGSEARLYDVMVYESGSGARAGVCVKTDAARQRLVLKTAAGLTSVSFSAVIGKAVDKNDAAGKFVGALAEIYPASSLALFTLSAAVTAIAVIASVKRRGKIRGGKISGRNSVEEVDEGRPDSDGDGQTPPAEEEGGDPARISAEKDGKAAFCTSERDAHGDDSPENPTD